MIYATKTATYTVYTKNEKWSFVGLHHRLELYETQVILYAAKSNNAYHRLDKQCMGFYICDYTF